MWPSDFVHAVNALGSLPPTPSPVFYKSRPNAKTYSEPSGCSDLIVASYIKTANKMSNMNGTPSGTNPQENSAKFIRILVW